MGYEATAPINKTNPPKVAMLPPFLARISVRQIFFSVSKRKIFAYEENHFSSFSLKFFLRTQ